MGFPYIHNTLLLRKTSSTKVKYNLVYYTDLNKAYERVYFDKEYSFYRYTFILPSFKMS